MDPLTLLDGKHCLVSQARSFDLPGYLIVEMKRSHSSLASMDPAEHGELMEYLAKAEAIVRSHTRAERVYVLRFGEENEQVHFHVVPRTPEVLEAYLAARSDEPPYSGARVVDWVWFHHRELGYSREDVLAWVRSAREHLASEAEQPAAWHAMANAARSYCAWVDSLPVLTHAERDSAEDEPAHVPRVEEARRQLLALLTAGAALEEVDVTSDETHTYEVAKGDRVEAQKKIAALPLGYYWSVAYGEDPAVDDSPTMGDVFNDLVDIWLDLKCALLAWDDGHYEEAAWEWRFSLNHHWGIHAVDALRQLHGWILG